MADVSKININSTTYSLKDATARQMIEDLPSPMVFKGTLGTDGTISDLPTAAKSNVGHTYKVITAGTYGGKTAKVGDLFICRACGTDPETYEWVLVPSGDEPSGTVTNIATGTGLTGGPITTTGTISVDTSVIQEKLVFNTTYSATENKAATMTDIQNAIGDAIAASY